MNIQVEELLEKRRLDRQQKIDARTTHFKKASAAARQSIKARGSQMSLTFPKAKPRIYTKPIRAESVIRAELKQMLLEQITDQRKRWGFK